MSMNNSPTHPKITETDDVEGHARRGGFHAQSEPNEMAMVGGPQERSTDDEDVEGHGKRSPVDAIDDVTAHARKLPPVAAEDDVRGQGRYTPVDANEDVEGHAARGKF